ncbi:uroporphyrinogen-III C-methyltransferase [Trichloromonas sp.]|uniref:uroporphyrinogen-III C-methyltransferase n=1 Tax=Trichloromonas sp. TaxID=3069249 RepID=UPI002A4D672E|nr:uroporphyrinogen-III C-methyltransferase [Desulfuromonadales bacterium]MBN2792297.1 uroporphyrinogen-III C-methyltransferase [Desulfuromonadales bacterium]MDY0269868.1 uroporphyrinogen-III C-methyltransferase [Trichloromonas sp.]
MKNSGKTPGSLPILLTSQEILLLGGGATASRKAKVLKENTIPFRVIAELVDERIFDLDVPVEQRRIVPADLGQANIVVDATGSSEVLEMLGKEKQQRFFLLNCASRPDLCDFYFSVMANRGGLKIAVSTDGASPVIGQVGKDRIATMIPEDLNGFIEHTKRGREQDLITPEKTVADCLQNLATVYLIGCGPGAPDLLTLKAYKTMQQVDVVFYDHLLTDDILALVPDSTEKIPVGKQKGHHSVRQEQINDLLWDRAQQGLKIARLKNGDPFIFGRGAEEMEFLVKRGVRVEVINGISSAIAGPASAGIPPTARGYATNLSIVSAHLAGTRLNTDWLPLLTIPQHTTIILMGLTFAAEISQLALAAGINGERPVAIISNATRANQTVIVTNIEQLPKHAAKAERPALLVIGDVINLQQRFSRSTTLI